MPSIPVFFEFDKKGAEWVVVAYMSGDTQMMRICFEELDPHIETSILISGAPRELIIQENEIIGHATDPILIEHLREEHCPDLLSGGFFLPRNMSIRQCGKKSNHGLNYDMGYVTFAMFSGMMQSDAQRVKGLYNKEYPGVPRWHNSIKRQLRLDRTLYSCQFPGFRRKYTFRGPLSDDTHKEAYAFGPQGTVADVVNRGIKRTWKDPTLEDWETLSQTHDSMLNQVYLDPSSTEDIYETAKGIQQICAHLNPLLSYEDREFRIATDIKLGLNWGAASEDNSQGLTTVKVEDLENLSSITTGIEAALEKVTKNVEEAA